MRPRLRVFPLVFCLLILPTIAAADEISTLTPSSFQQFSTEEFVTIDGTGLQGTATTMLEHWDRVAADPVQARKMLERIARHAQLASGVLEDLVRGLPPGMEATLSSLDRR